MANEDNRAFDAMTGGARDKADMIFDESEPFDSNFRLERRDDPDAFEFGDPTAEDFKTYSGQKRWRETRGEVRPWETSFSNIPYSGTTQQVRMDHPVLYEGQDWAKVLKEQGLDIESMTKLYKEKVGKSDDLASFKEHSRIFQPKYYEESFTDSGASGTDYHTRGIRDTKSGLRTAQEYKKFLTDYKSGQEIEFSGYSSDTGSYSEKPGGKIFEKSPIKKSGLLGLLQRAIPGGKTGVEYKDLRSSEEY